MRDLLRDQKGITLVETILSISIFAMAMAAALGILFVGDVSRRYMVPSEDQTQNLRVAMKQIADDVKFAQWKANSLTNGITIQTYSPLVSRSRTTTPQSDWSLYPSWPGDFTGRYLFWINYQFEDACLVREVWSSAGMAGRRVVACGLVPPTEAGGSQLAASNADHYLTVKLVSRQEIAGVTRIAEIQSTFFLGQIP